MKNIESSPAKLTLQKEGLLPQEEVLERARKKKNLLIGIPAEADDDENRITLTPQGVEILVNAGHKVIIETMAGEGANYSNLAYSEVGGIVVDEKAEVYKCDLILKVSPLTLEEIDLLIGKQIVISALLITSSTE